NWPSLVPKLPFGNALFRNAVSPFRSGRGRNGVSQSERSQTGVWEREASLTRLRECAKSRLIRRGPHGSACAAAALSFGRGRYALPDAIRAGRGAPRRWWSKNSCIRTV